MARTNRAPDLAAAILASTYEFTPYRATEPETAQVDGWGDFWNEEVTELDVEGYGRLVVIETEGGEGQGDHAHIVFKLTAEDGTESFFKVDGYYSSYDGVDWDYVDLYEVTPKQKTITVYE